MSASPALPLPGPFNTSILPFLVSQSVEHWLNTHTNGVIASQLWCRDQERRKTMTCHHKEGPVRTTAQEHRDGKSGFKSSHKGWGDGQLAKFLLCKHKILSSIPRTIKTPRAGGSRRAGSAIKITASLAGDLSPFPGTYTESSQWLKEIHHLQSQWAPVLVCTYPHRKTHTQFRIK